MVQTGSSLPFSRGSCARMQAMRCRGRRVRSSTRSTLKGRSFSRRGTASMRSLCTSLRRDMASSSFRRSTHWKTSKICSGSNQNWLRKLPHPQPAVCHAGMTCIAQGYWQIVNGFMQFEITAFPIPKAFKEIYLFLLTQGFLLQYCSFLQGGPEAASAKNKTNTTINK